MSGKMKAAVVREFGKPLTLEELDIPEIRPDQILVKMIACGVCHTDLHAAAGDWPKNRAFHLSPAMKALAPSSRPAVLSPMCGRGMLLVCPGSIPPAGIVNTALAGGKRSAVNRKIPAIPSTDALRNMWWRTRITWLSSPRGSTLCRSPRTVRGAYGL